MAKARVVLHRALTFDAGKGRVFKKGEPQVITGDAEIAYYEAQPEFTVTRLNEVAPKKAAEKAPEPPPPPVVKHTRESLEKMTKNELVSLASQEPFNLALEPDMKKGDMVDAMSAAIEGDDEADDDGDDEE